MKQSYHVDSARLQGTVYHTLDLLLLSCLYDMEKRGIGLDIDMLTTLSRKLSDKMTYQPVPEISSYATF